MDPIEKFEQLVLTKSLEVQPGVFLTCKDKINLSIYEKNGEIIVDFGSPAMYIEAGKGASLGDKIKIRFIKPKVENVVISKTQITVKLDPLGEVSFDRS